jgi:hypothetical protein
LFIFPTEFWKKHGYLPTVEELLKLWYWPYDWEEVEALTESDPADGKEAQLLDNDQAKVDEMNRQKLIFTWFWNNYLPNFTKDSFFGPKIRSKKLLNETVAVAGKEWVPVTTSTEALAIVSYENNLDRWQHLFEKKSNDEEYNYNNDPNKDDIPKPKWSNGKTGQQGFGGWSDEGQQKWKHYRDHARSCRKKDEDSDEKVMIYIRDLCASKIMNKATAKKDNKKGKTATSSDVNLFDSVDIFGEGSMFDYEE